MHGETFDIAWKETGAANSEALVFLHAMAGSSTAWAPQMDRLSTRYRCIAWDMPGFGYCNLTSGNLSEVCALRRFTGGHAPQ